MIGEVLHDESHACNRALLDLLVLVLRLQPALDDRVEGGDVRRVREDGCRRLRPKDAHKLGQDAQGFGDGLVVTVVGESDDGRLPKKASVTVRERLQGWVWLHGTSLGEGCVAHHERRDVRVEGGRRVRRQSLL